MPKRFATEKPTRPHLRLKIEQHTIPGHVTKTIHGYIHILTMFHNYLAHAQTVDTRPLFRGGMWPGNKASALSADMLTLLLRYGERQQREYSDSTSDSEEEDSTIGIIAPVTGLETDHVRLIMCIQLVVDSLCYCD